MELAARRNRGAASISYGRRGDEGLRRILPLDPRDLFPLFLARRNREASPIPRLAAHFLGCSRSSSERPIRRKPTLASPPCPIQFSALFCMMAEIISDHTLPAVLTFILGVIVGGVSIGSFLLTFSPLSAFTSDRPSRPNLIAISTLGPSAPRPRTLAFSAPRRANFASRTRRPCSSTAPGASPRVSKP